MTLVKSGDLVFSFYDTKIKTVGVATGPVETADRPNFGTTGENWAQEGWLVPVEFAEIGAGVRPKDFIKELRPHLAEKYAPLQANGNGNQVAYLVNISDDFAEIMLTKIGKPASFFTTAIVTEKEKRITRPRKRSRVEPTLGQHKNNSLFKRGEAREFSNRM
jgi:putative restriction endonuclease